MNKAVDILHSQAIGMLVRIHSTMERSTLRKHEWILQVPSFIIPDEVFDLYFLLISYDIIVNQATELLPRYP